MTAAALGLLLVLGASLDVPPLTGRVVDLAEILGPTTEAALTDRLAAFEAESSTQVAVLTVPSLEGEVLEAYATRVFRTWGLGQAGRDNGVLVLVALADREVRIEVGYGLEGALTDATAGSIIRHRMVPAFRVGAYETGVLDGVDAILKATRGEYVAEPDGGVGWLGKLFLVLMMVVFPLGAFSLAVASSGGVGWKGAVQAGCLGVFGGCFLGLGLVVLADWPWGFAVGLVAVPLALIVLNVWLEEHPVYGPKRRHRRAKQAAFATARARGRSTVVVGGRTYAVPARSSSSGSSGGFSGGGGSSGGGGASGSW